MLFMYNWLQNNTNAMKNEPNKEREELDKLRKELQKLKEEKQKENNQNDFSPKLSKIHSSHSESSDDSQEENDADAQKEFDKHLQEQRNKIMKRGQRSSVSAEAFGIFNKKAEFKPRVIPKKPEQIETIKKKLTQSFIFNALENQYIKTVLIASD